MEELTWGMVLAENANAIIAVCGTLAGYCLGYILNRSHK